MKKNDEPFPEESIISAGWSAVFPGPNFNVLQPSHFWEGKTVITNAGVKGLGVYDVNSEWCPPGIKYHALKIIQKSK